MLKIFSTVEFIQNLFVLIVLDFSSPQIFIESLNDYLNSLTELFYQMKIPLSKLDVLRELMVALWQAYQEPILDEDGNLIKREKVQISE